MWGSYEREIIVRSFWSALNQTLIWLLCGFGFWLGSVLPTGLGQALIALSLFLGFVLFSVVFEGKFGSCRWIELARNIMLFVMVSFVLRALVEQFWGPTTVGLQGYLLVMAGMFPLFILIGIYETMEELKDA